MEKKTIKEKQEYVRDLLYANGIINRAAMMIQILLDSNRVTEWAIGLRDLRAAMMGVSSNLCYEATKVEDSISEKEESLSDLDKALNRMQNLLDAIGKDGKICTKEEREFLNEMKVGFIVRTHNLDGEKSAMRKLGYDDKGKISVLYQSHFNVNLVDVLGGSK